MYRLHNNGCRACNFGRNIGPNGIKSSGTSEKLIPVFSLGIQPLANNFCEDGDEREGYAPLEVLYCPRCTLAQLSVVVNPDTLYRNYAYVTSQSQTMLKHFERLWAEISFRVKPPQDEVFKVLEIGSNDGTFLNWIKQQGKNRVCGIDPARNLFPETVDAICKPFSQASAEEAAFYLKGNADVIIARHVFCHVDDWQGFISALDEVTHEESLIVIEVPYAGKLLSQCEWDTIYHEHTSYLTFKAMGALLQPTRYQIGDIVDFDIHGGVVAIMIRHKESQSGPSDEAIHRVQSEHIKEHHWQEFSQRAHGLCYELKRTVADLRSNGKSVCGFGASAKTTVMFNACGFTRKDISFVTDTTKGKWFKTVPGTDIPVVDEGALLRELPDYAIMGAWNYRIEILEKNKAYTDKGCRFIVPVPEVEIVP